MRIRTGFKLLVSAALVSTLIIGSVSSTFAQEALPRDNGLFSYHRAPDYRESESHPLRIVGYLLHPVGWVSRELVFRPISAFMSSTRFTRSFFGYRDPYDYRETFCFAPTDDFPDCQQVAPLNSLASVPSTVGGAGEEGADDGAGEDAAATAAVSGGERQVFFPDVAFEFDKASLNDLGRGRVRQIAQLLQSVPSLKVSVEGHTDFIGSDQYNQSLGQKRAQTVIGELSTLGIDPARMSSLTFGESRPIFTEEEDWARAVNRRVQFSIQGEEQASAPAEEEEDEEAAS